MKLKELFKGVQNITLSGNENEEIKGIAYSSKKVDSGYLFAALKGENFDGSNFIKEAVEKGAVAVLSENPRKNKIVNNWIQVNNAREALALCSANFYSHPSKKLKTIGITGTKGKTTISYILENILKKSGERPGVIGTISYRGPHINIPAERTTPEAPDIQRIMKEMLNQNVTHCLIEVSSHSIELNRILGIDFDVEIFTNLSGEHLDYHQTMDHYFNAKKKLFLQGNKKRIAIINQDDPWGKKLISLLPLNIISYGIEEGALIKAQKYNLSEHGTNISVKYPGGSLSVSSPMLGKPNLYNLLASIATSLVLKVTIPAIKEGTALFKGAPGRFEEIKNSFGFRIFVDYAHTDAALEYSLETMKILNPNKIILVFGAGGDRDKTKRERMGKVAGTHAHLSIITNDNPRSEDPSEIIAAIEKGIKQSKSDNYKIIPDRKKAIEYAINQGQKGDCILVAGKGHENYQIIKNKVTHFDDAEIIKEILNYKKGNS
ncbi:MAG: UDP-N-acetylmuramoyl-L-alanyl-D-glutamate--2,6-diaminopimelate ligase [Candidatus Aminicenantaceae bacterium]